METKSIVALTSLACAVPAFAIERPKAADEPKAKEAPATEKAKEAKPADKPAAEKVRAYLGVYGRPATKTLSLHLNLPEGKGLVLEHIAKDSPAEKAGLKRHDIITSIGGKNVRTQKDLREAILAHKPGAQVDFSYITKGKENTTKVELGKAPARPQGLKRGEFNFPGGKGNFHFLRGGEIPKELLEKLPEGQRKQIEELMKGKVKDLLKNKDLKNLLPEGLEGLDLDNLKKKGGFQAEMLSEFTMIEKDGSRITLKTRNGKKEVRIKDKEGKLIFEGPCETEIDMASVPEKYRERVEKMSQSNTGNGKRLFKFEFGK